jgi:hypothetical protein
MPLNLHFEINSNPISLRKKKPKMRIRALPMNFKTTLVDWQKIL